MTFATKIRHLAAAALLAFGPAANAALPYTDGDLILGIRASGGQGATTCYEVNIGHASSFAGVGSGFTVDLGGDILDDLNLIFGADWKTRSDVFWSISGVQFVGAGAFANRTIFASKAEPTAGTQSTPWTRVTLSTQNPVALRVQALGTPGYSAGTTGGTPGQTESTHSTKALIQDTGAANSYASHMPGGSNSTVGSAYQFFVNGALGIENTFANGTSASVLDLYQLTPGSAGTNATFFGAFRLNDGAQLTFSPNPGDFIGAANVAFDSANYSVGEDGGTVAFTVSRMGTTTSAFTLNFSTANGTAVAGTDFTGQTNTAVAFASGETMKTVTVAIADLPGFQGDRSFSGSIALASGTATLIAPSTATVTITENDPQPSMLAFSAANYTVLETGGTVSVTISRTGSTTGAVSVNFSTQDGTALAGANFTGQTNVPVNFADGEASRTVDVQIADNPAFTGDLEFGVTLSGGTNGATVGSPGSATVTIQETDTNPAGQIAFSSASYRFASKNALGQPNTVVLTLTRTNGLSGAVSTDVSLAGGGNLDGLDFSFTSPTTVNFADGQSTATVNVPLLAGAGPLPGTINFSLGNATDGASIGAIGATSVAITVPDKVPPKILLTTPKPGKSGAVFNVTGTVTEPDPLDRVEVRLNGGAAQLATLTGNAFTLNSLAAENGANTLLVQAFDINGTASLVKKVIFTYVNERPQFAGSYNGLATPTGAAPVAGDMNNSSGFLTVAVGKTGTFTGKIAIGGAVLPFKGVFANNGTARFSPALGATLALVKKGKPPVAFGELSLAVTAGKVTGNIGVTALVDCDLAAFNSKTAPLDAAVLANKGKFTCVLPSESQPVLTAPQFPQGDGIGTITVLKTGKLTFVGSLADGTPVVASAPLSANYSAPLHAALYGKKGSIAGVVTISLADLADANADSDISGGNLLWLRPDNSAARAKPKHYPEGWPGGVHVSLVGASYNGAKQVPPASVFPGLNASGEATLQFAGGKLSAPMQKDLLISTSNKVSNIPATDKSTKLSIASSTGALLGNFTHSDGTKPAFKGIIYQKGPARGGYGYFLSTSPKLGPSGESGGVSVVAKP
jgi:Calx-beta domain